VLIFGLFFAGPLPLGWSQSQENPLQRGIQALKAGDFAEAENIFSTAVRQNPSAANFYYLAISQWSAGKVDPAILHFRRSIQLGNHSEGVHYYLGLAYLKQGDMGPGVRELRQALSINPTLKSARYTLAVALLEAGHPDESIPQFMRLQEETPCDAAVWANLVRAYFEIGNIEAAIHTTETAVEGMPSKVPLFVTLATLCSEHQQFQKARFLLESASEL